MSIITITTDFGNSIFSAILNAVILKEYPRANIQIISNNIEKFSIKNAIFYLENSYFYFPENTVHLCVVDPGVGSNRRGLIINTEKYWFVGPDNGVFSFINSNKIKSCYEIIYKPESWSYTFHGRDIFAPVAAKIAKGINVREIGKEIKWEETITSKFKFNSLREVIFIDDFGNIFLDLKYEDLKKIVGNKKFKIIFKEKVFEKLRKFYYEVEKGDLLLLVNSLDYLEIAQREGNAKNVLNAKVGDKYEIKIDES